MLPTSPVRLLRRTLLLLPIALLYGCSDDSTPLGPRADTKPHALLAPVVTVMNTDDAGAGSLRQALIDATDGGTIQFDASIAGQTIVLSTGYLYVDKSLTIEGPVSAGMTISGGFLDRVFLTDFNTDVVFRNLAIVNGNDQTSGGGGGGIWDNGKLLLDHVLIANNQTGNTGGGIFVKSSGQLTLVNSTVSGNVAASGGGIEAGAPITLWNSTITNNASSFGGGVIIGLDSKVNLRNSIIANNVDSNGHPNCYVQIGSEILFSGKNLSNDDSCGIDPSMIIADPLLGPLANNGGPTLTHAILSGSPAIDAGTACSEATDQRYVARNQGLSCDIGAFEFNTFDTVALTFGPNVAVNPKTGAAKFAGTIACSAPASVELIINVSQTQKTTGRFPTIVSATGGLTVYCNTSASSWSLTLTSGNGKFQNGSATGTVETATVPAGFLRSSVTTTLKLFQVK